MMNTRAVSVLMLLIILVAVGQMAQTIYVPGIPLIARDLMVREGAIQRLMAAYLLCYGGSQLIYGPLSESGRAPAGHLERYGDLLPGDNARHAQLIAVADDIRLRYSGYRYRRRRRDGADIAARHLRWSLAAAG